MQKPHAFQTAHLGLMQGKHLSKHSTYYWIFLLASLYETTLIMYATKSKFLSLATLYNHVII